MEIRQWQYCVIFNCILLNYLEAKTFSLNEIIAAESQQKEAFEPTLPPLRPAAGPGRRNSLIKRLSPTSRVKKFLESGFFDHKTIGNKIISPLKYRKTYLIKTPLKPRRLKLIQKSRYKRKNQSVKREINGNEDLKQKYIPLLKSLTMLFDNLLNSDSSDSYEVKTKKFKRNRFYSMETFEVPRNCTQQTDSGNSEPKSKETAVTVAPTFTFETSTATQDLTVSEAPPTSTDFTTARHFSTFRQNKNIPVLLSRNTSSSRRNDNGISEGSSTTLHGNIEGNFTRNHGDHEHSTRCAENESCTENDEKNSFSFTRDGTRGFQFSGPRGNRNNTGIFSKGNRTKENSKIESDDDDIREIHIETGRNETESPRILQQSLQRLRGSPSEDVNQSTESVHSKEVREESFVDVPHDNTSYQRIIDRSGSVAQEDQKISKGNETITLLNDVISTSTKPSKPSKKNLPVLMIFDGYSIARHKNGENKFSEKSIRIHS